MAEKRVAEAAARWTKAPPSTEMRRLFPPTQDKPVAKIAKQDFGKKDGLKRTEGALRTNRTPP